MLQAIKLQNKHEAETSQADHQLWDVGGVAMSLKLSSSHDNPFFIDGLPFARARTTAKRHHHPHHHRCSADRNQRENLSEVAMVAKVDLQRQGAAAAFSRLGTTMAKVLALAAPEAACPMRTR